MGRKIVRRKVRRKFNKEDKKLRIIDDRIKSDITTIQNAENAFEKESIPNFIEFISEFSVSDIFCVCLSNFAIFVFSSDI